MFVLLPFKRFSFSFADYLWYMFCCVSPLKIAIIMGRKRRSRTKSRWLKFFFVSVHSSFFVVVVACMLFLCIFFLFWLYGSTSDFSFHFRREHCHSFHLSRLFFLFCFRFALFLVVCFVCFFIVSLISVVFSLSWAVIERVSRPYTHGTATIALDTRWGCLSVVVDRCCHKLIVCATQFTQWDLLLSYSFFARFICSLPKHTHICIYIVA